MSPHLIFDELEINELSSVLNGVWRSPDIPINLSLEPSESYVLTFCDFYYLV